SPPAAPRRPGPARTRCPVGAGGVTGDPPRDHRLGSRLGTPPEAIAPRGGGRSSRHPTGRTSPSMTEVTPEPAAREIADATAHPPFLYELGPDGARKVLDDIQAAPIE